MNIDRFTPTERVTHLWMTVFGVTGTNGMYGRSKEVDAEIKRLGEKFEKYDILEIQIRTLARVGQWVLVVIGTVMGLLVSGNVGDFLGNILKVGMGK